VNKMYGYVRGYGFRGFSPAWPYVGRGRGGLPRCWYPGFSPSLSLTRDQELNFLKTQAELLKDQLSQIESRINELQTK